MAVDWGTFDAQYGQARAGGGPSPAMGSADKPGWNPNASLISNLSRYARDPEFNIRGGDLSLASQVYNSFLGGISAGIIQSEHISDKDYGVIGDVAKTLTSIVGLGLALEGAGPLFAGLAKLGVRVPYYLRAPLTGMIYGGASPTGKEFGSAADIEARLKAGGETAAIFSLFPASERLIAGGMKLKPGISARTAMAEDFAFKPGLLGGTAPSRAKQAIASGVTFGGYGAGEAVRRGEDPFKGGLGGGLAGLILGGKRKVPLFTPPESRIVPERKAKSRFAELGDVVGEAEVPVAPVAPDVFLDSFTRMQQANIKKAGLSAEQIADLTDGQLAKAAGIGEKTRDKARELTNWEESEAGIQARAVEADLAKKGVTTEEARGLVDDIVKQRDKVIDSGAAPEGIFDIELRNPKTGEYKISGEGPFETLEDAIEFGKSEVGARHRIINTETGEIFGEGGVAKPELTVLGEQKVTDKLGLKKTEPKPEKPKKRRTQMRSKTRTRKTEGKGATKATEPEAPKEITAEPEPVVKKEPTKKAAKKSFTRAKLERMNLSELENYAGEYGIDLSSVGYEGKAIKKPTIDKILGVEKPAKKELLKEVAAKKEPAAEKKKPKKATSLFKGKKLPKELHIEDPDRRGKLIRYVEKAEHSTEDFVRLLHELDVDIVDIAAKGAVEKQVSLLFKSRENLNALKKVHGETGAVIVKGKGKSKFKEGETVKVVRSTGETVIGTATGKVTSGGFEKVRLRGDRFAKGYDPKKVEVASEFERDITPDKEPEIKEVKDKKKPKKEKVTRVTADSVVVELTDKARASGEYGKAKQEILNELEAIEEISAEGMRKVTEYAAEAGEAGAIAELNYLGRLMANFQPVVHVMGKIGDKKGVSQYAKVYNPMKEGYEASLREQASIMDASRDWVFRKILPKSGRETKRAAESFDAIQIIMDGATEAEFVKEYGRKPTPAERESVGRLRILYDALHDYYGIEGWKEYYTPIRVNARKMYNVVVVEKKAQNLNEQEQKWYDDYQARGAVYASAEITGAPRESIDFFAELADRGILNPVLDNALTTLTGYVRAGSAAKWLDPQIQRIKAEYGAKGDELYHIFETTGEKGIKWSGDKLSRNTAKIVNDYLMHMMGMRSQLEQGMNKKMDSMFKRINSIAPGKGELVPGHTDAAYASRFFTDMIYLGGMGGRVGSALKNITQQTHTAGEIGTRWLVRGYKDFATERGLKLIRDANIYHEFGPNMQREVNIATNRRAQVMDIGLKLFQTADKVNRATAYLGAHAKMLKYKDKISLTFVRKAQRGYIEKFMKEGNWDDAAVAYGKYVVQETQFLYTRADGAPIFRNPVGKMFGQFMTWPMWATSKYVQWGGALARNPKQLFNSPLMRYLVASALLLEGADKIAGVDIVPWIGFGILPTDIGGPIYKTFRDAGGAMVSGTQLAQAKTFGSERMEKFAKRKFKRHIRGLEREAKLYPFSYAIRDIGRFIEAGDIRDLLGLPKSEGK